MIRDSSIRVARFTAQELLDFLAQPGMEDAKPAVSPQSAAELAGFKHSYALYNAYGQMIAAAGVIEFWKDRAEGWAFFSPESGRHMTAVTREVMRFLRDCPIVRIEATAELRFNKGHKWLRMLGFKQEAERLSSYRQGIDHALYARVRKD